MAESPLGQPATRSSSRNRNSADLQQVITGDAAGATEPNNAGAGAPTTKAGKEKAEEDAAAASSAEASGALKKLVDSSQAVDPPGATLPPCKSRSNGSLKVETICKRLPVYAISSTDGGRVLEVEARPALKVLAETSSPLKLRRGEVSRYIGDRKIRLGRGPKLLGEEPIKALEQRVAGWIPVTVREGNLTVALTCEHEELEWPQCSTRDQALLIHRSGRQWWSRREWRCSPYCMSEGALRVLRLSDHIRSEEDVMRENTENSMEGNTQIKPPGQADEEGEGTYQATGRSRDNGLQTPQGLPLVQRAEECETVGEYLRCRLDLPRVEQIASKDVGVAHVVSRWRVVQHAHAGMIELGWPSQWGDMTHAYISSFSSLSLMFLANTKEWMGVHGTALEMVGTGKAMNGMRAGALTVVRGPVGSKAGAATYSHKWQVGQCGGELNYPIVQWSTLEFETAFPAIVGYTTVRQSTLGFDVAMVASVEHWTPLPNTVLWCVTGHPGGRHWKLG
ncbi:hypothetical protein JB92DRAFT_3099243 [Gautieria morchelliformis]|nr:hypothetical protein JB92DRAFT_3099243 [Gautieria morchelliformis]